MLITLLKAEFPHFKVLTQYFLFCLGTLVSLLKNLHSLKIRSLAFDVLQALNRSEIRKISVLQYKAESLL